MGHARRRHTPEQMIRKLREADRLLGEGQEVALVAKQLEVSEQTLQRWRAQYGGLKADGAKRLKELERENNRLKRIVADQLLENQALKEIAKGRNVIHGGTGTVKSHGLLAAGRLAADSGVGCGHGPV